MSSLLHFREDGTFTIALFEDVHWRNGGAADQRSAALMEHILEAEQPDLVVINGDLIHGGACLDPAQSWRDALGPVLARGLPWAAVFGNHDEEGSLSRTELMELQRGLPGCLSEPGPATVAGVGNYLLSIGERSVATSAAHLYFLDSHSYADAAVGGYDWIKHDQVTWYRQTAAELRKRNGGQILPALAFFHIPLPEYRELWSYQPCFGARGEPICAPLINTGLFAAFVEAGDVAGVFVGHDHLNDFIGELHSIRLAFGRVTGYGGYGTDELAPGSRLIRLHQGRRDFETWLRVEGGERISQQPVHQPEESRTLCLPTDYT